jgi:hypothetical protein
LRGRVRRHGRRRPSTRLNPSLENPARPR